MAASVEFVGVDTLEPNARSIGASKGIPIVHVHNLARKRLS
jgi:hypothetical protein